MACLQASRMIDAAAAASTRTAGRIQFAHSIFKMQEGGGMASREHLQKAGNFVV